MASTYRQVAQEEQGSVPANTTTANALLDHLSSLADVAYPQEIITIETVNTMQR
jgi:hypothetical protein